jgi:hypothetical protein
MEQQGGQFELPKFSSPEEELKYLRERVKQKEEQVWQENTPANKEAAISTTVLEYTRSAPEIVPEERHLSENPQFEKVVEHLSSLPHREKVRELYHILAEKGVMTAIRAAQSQNNPHIEEDFHRVLVEYVKSGGLVPGLDREKDLSKELRMTVFEVTLPFAGAQEGAPEASFHDVMNAMERFYVGMIPAEGAKLSQFGPIALELALSNFSNDIVFYMSVEEHMKDLFVKQLLGSFPMAKIEESPADFNVFNEFGTSTASYGEVIGKFVYPIQLMDDGEKDPLTTIINAFTKIERDGEGAAVQIILYPETGNLIEKMKFAMNQMRQGVPPSRATNIPLSLGGGIAKTFTEFFHTELKGDKKDDNNAKDSDAISKATALIEEKLKSSLVRANMRIVASAGTIDRANAIRTSIEAAFSQFNRPQGAGIKFTQVEKGKLDELFHRFTYREVSDDDALVFNTKELSCLYHLPLAVSQKDAPQLRTVKASSAPAPADLPHEGTLIGINKYRGEAREVRLTKADRLRHLYVIGQTGTGKSVFLKSLILQDVIAGNGACFIDPHGSDVQDVLAAIPKERLDDVIYFDPSYMERPYALNMLEFDPAHPEQKIFVVNEMFAIFRKLYSSSPESMGPAFEQYFRNATMLVMDDPESGNTLLDIPRVLADANFRNMKLARCKNPLVVQFWRDIATKTSGESGLQNMIPYITNKFDVFIQNDIMRPIIAQEKSSFNFREIMDQKKILLVNLSKGKLGEMNANLLGLIIIGKFLMAAMSRVDSFGTKLPDFYLYVDEFQNVATPSISAILSEARKYGLSLNLAHQFIAQLPEDIKGAVFGNVGNMVTFRVGTEDAEFLASQYAPIFKASDIMKIENLNAYAKILVDGKPVPPFNIALQFPPKGHPEMLEQLRNLSYLKYGRDRATVEEGIMKRYMNPTPATPTPGAMSASQPTARPTLRPIPTSAPVTPAAPVAPTLQATPVSPTPPLRTDAEVPAPLTPAPVTPAQVIPPQNTQTQIAPSQNVQEKNVLAQNIQAPNIPVQNIPTPQIQIAPPQSVAPIASSAPLHIPHAPELSLPHAPVQVAPLSIPHAPAQPVSSPVPQVPHAPTEPAPLHIPHAPTQSPHLDIPHAPRVAIPHAPVNEEPSVAQSSAPSIKPTQFADAFSRADLASSSDAYISDEDLLDPFASGSVSSAVKSALSSMRADSAA